LSEKARIVTLTLNPAIDISSEAETVRHTHKIRTKGEAMEPGGGGINVSRVLDKLGADVTALFLGGGPTGRVLDELLKRAGIARRMIEIAEDSRISLTVLETSTGNEFRFVPEGPEVTKAEADAVLDAATSMDCDYFVASGSLPRGMAEDFYAQLGARVTAERPYLLAEVAYAVKHEFARTLGDLFIRRIPLAFETADHGASAARHLAPMVARSLGKDASALIAEYEGEILRMFAIT